MAGYLTAQCYSLTRASDSLNVAYPGRNLTLDSCYRFRVKCWFANERPDLALCRSFKVGLMTFDSILRASKRRMAHRCSDLLGSILELPS